MDRDADALELYLLGGFRARLASGASVDLPTRKARALLAYLALRPDRPHARTTLATLLWGDRPDSRAHNSLSQAVTGLRRALVDAAPSPLTIDTDSLTFHAGAATTDVAELERHAARTDVESLERAQALYAGELLAGIGVHEPGFEDWLETERGRLRSLVVEALGRLMSARLDAGEPDHAARSARRLLAFDALDERAHRALMRAHAMQGQPGLALRQYRDCAERLRAELGISPDAETTRLRDELFRERAPEPVPGAPTAAAVPPETTAPPARAIPARSAGRPPLARVSPWRRWLVAGVGVALLVLLAGGLLVDRVLDDGVTGGGDALPDAPSIAVLPFLDLSPQPEQRHLADGLAEDLITDLAQVSGLFVIARHSAFALRDREMPAERIAARLGVRYLLEGSIRRTDRRVRVNVALVDGSTGGHVWARRYDSGMDEVFALRERIARRVVDALEAELLPAELRRLRHRATRDADAYDAYLLGLADYYRRTPADNAAAVAHFERAIQLDPDYAAAYTALAKVYARAMVEAQAYADALGIHWSEGYTHARRLLEHARAAPDADYYVLRSWLALRKHQHAAAIEAARLALERRPNDPDALEALAEALILDGRVDEGAELARQAMRRNPLLQGRPLYLLALADFARGDAAAAVRRLERAMAQARGRSAERAGLLAAALGRLGRRAAAGEAFARFREAFLNRPDRAASVRAAAFANPRFHTWRRVDLAWSAYTFPFADPAVLDRLASGLEAAGAPASVGGYLPLHRGNRLGGERIQSLLFGRVVAGTDFWLATRRWQQRRDSTGRVTHSGYPVHPGLPRRTAGRGRIEGDRLCERWPDLGSAYRICVSVFRVPDEAARDRWGDYVMVTDTGPHPFSVRR